MSRTRRTLSRSGWAHIILRGINRENLFYDAADFDRFHSTVERYRKQCGCEIAVMCMMSNHVHILMRMNDSPFSVIMKKIAVSYAHYYNTKYDRVGHVFQDRFRSEPVDDEPYFFTVLRYIFQNPQKAGICAAANYPHTFIYNDGILSDYFPDTKSLMDFLTTPDNSRCLEFNSTRKATDEALMDALQEFAGFDNPQLLQGMKKGPRDSLLRDLKQQGFSVSQLSRLTGLNRNVIQRA